MNKKGTKQKKEKQGEKGVESLKDLNTRVPKPVRYQVLSSLPHSAQRSAEGAPATSMALLCAQSKSLSLIALSDTECRFFSNPL